MLADVAKPLLSAVERNLVYVMVGVGETLAAFRSLVTLFASRQIALPGDLVQQCISLLDAYIGHEEEPRLRRLIETHSRPRSNSNYMREQLLTRWRPNPPSARPTRLIEIKGVTCDHLSARDRQLRT